MIESALVFDNQGRVIRYHLPQGRTSGSIPDTRDLWEVLWKWRAQLGGVAHTHPWKGRATPSQTDVTTFRACEQALGQLLKWPVVTFDDIGIFVWSEESGFYVHEYDSDPDFIITLMPAIERLRELSQ